MRKFLKNVFVQAATPSRMVLLSNMRWSGMGQTNRQAWALAVTELNKDVKVLYVETLGWQPIPKMKPLSVAERVEVIHAWNVVPHAGRPTRIWSRRVNAVFTWIQILLIRPSFVMPHLLVAFDPLSRALVRLIRANHSLYDCLDLYSEQPQYSSSAEDRRALEMEERRLALAVERVSVSARLLVEKFGGLANRPIFRAGAPMPLGVSPDGQSALDRRESSVRGLYIGALDHYKVDYDVFYSLLELDPNLSLTLVGRVHHSSVESERNLARLAAHNRVKLLDSVARSGLKDLLPHYDFGIIAMRPGRYSDHSYPLKVWDYLEGGLPVLSSGSVAMMDLQCGVVALENSRLLSGPSLDQVLEMRARAGEISAFAKQNSAIYRVSGVLSEAGFTFPRVSQL